MPAPIVGRTKAVFLPAMERGMDALDKLPLSWPELLLRTSASQLNSSLMKDTSCRQLHEQVGTHR